MNQKYTLVGVAVLILIFGYFLLTNKEAWLGTYYPDANNLFIYHQSPKFSSLDECRAWVNSQITLYNPEREGYDYECGKNCEFDSSLGVYVCDETLN